MPISTFTSTRRRRCFHQILKAIGIMLAVLMSAALVVFLINRFDEPLDRSAQAWLDYPGLAAPDGRNGYHALLAFDARNENAVALAGAMVRAHHAILADARKKRQDKLDRYREIRATLLDPVPAYLPKLADCKQDCHNYLAEWPAPLETYSVVNAGLLERYDAMLDFPAYAEDMPIDAEALSPNFGLASRIGLLHLGKSVHALQRGDAQTAYKAWARHHRFWQMAAAGSVSLNGFLKAVAQIERSQALLADMLDAHPKSRAIARRHVLPVLAERPKLAPMLARSLVHRFQLHAFAINDWFSSYTLRDIVTLGLLDDYSAEPLERLELLFYQPNATLNRLHRFYRNSMAQHGMVLGERVIEADEQAGAACDVESGWSRLVNPTGKQIACPVSLDVRAMHERIAKVAIKADELEQQLRSLR